LSSTRPGVGGLTPPCAQEKPLIVIVNERLMDNHQRELADAMAEKNYLLQVALRKPRSQLVVYEHM
jgi:UDP-N-acetylglucosamine transferase subunit ALG13